MKKSIYTFDIHWIGLVFLMAIFILYLIDVIPMKINDIVKGGIYAIIFWSIRIIKFEEE